MAQTIDRAPAEPIETESLVPIPPEVKQNVFVTSVNTLFNWARSNALWPFPLGTACCAIEFMAVGAGRFDISRCGAEVVRFSPRQADVMLVAGTGPPKMAPAGRRTYDPRSEPTH